MSTEIRGLTLKASDLEAQLRYKDEALSAASDETSNMHKALRSLDAERDSLQVRSACWAIWIGLFCVQGELTDGLLCIICPSGQVGKPDLCQ
jgi:hypothetical protein